MEREYWLKQEPGKPLFPELEWSRPENRQQAGRLLIAGGNLHGFAALAEAYAAAVQAGIGTARVLLPDAVQKIVGGVLENGEFAPSTKVSGSFSQKALGAFLGYGSWADAVLLAGDLGRNSETAILLEKFLARFPSAVTLTKDAIDYAVSAPHTVLSRPGTLLVLSLSQLQRLGTAARFPRPVLFSMDLLHLVEWLHDFTLAHEPYIIVRHHDQLLTAAHGRVSSTRLANPPQVWRVATAAAVSVWWLQNPSRPFEALTAALAVRTAP
jgi:ADP-dependent NAD(P)H-hydrate dehydratase / NAD(P)H-hydrate epimerase